MFHKHKSVAPIKPLLQRLVIASLCVLNMGTAVANPFNFWKTAVQSKQLTNSAISKGQTLKAQSEDLQKHLMPFASAVDTITRYEVSKANMWLSYATHEHSERSPTPAAKLALQQTAHIVNLLEQQQTPDVNALTLPMTASPRPDLWMTVQQLKAHPGFDCAAPEVAQAEVMLFWATAEHCELGWRHSREGFGAAQRLLNRATDAAYHCKADMPSQLPKLEHAIQLIPFDKKSCYSLFRQDAKTAP